MDYSRRSISNMSQNEIDKYPTENWMQERGLFYSERKNKNSYYFGGYSYEEVLDNRIQANVRLFKNTMKNLNDREIYLDIGAGNGKAIKEYRQLFPNGAKVVGIASTLPEEKALDEVIELDKNDEKFSFYLDDFTKFPTNSLAGRVSVITDVIGAIRYGRDPAQVIRKVGELLKEGGLAFFKFTYNDGIKVPEGYTNFRVIDRPYGSSTTLLYVWFQTIKGFDVIQEDMTLDESKDFQTTILDDIRYIQSRIFSNYTVVLRRNSDPVEVDNLIINPKVDEISQKDSEGGIYWDGWYPNYEWQMSSRSQSMLKNPDMEKIIF